MLNVGRAARDITSGGCVRTGFCGGRSAAFANHCFSVDILTIVYPSRLGVVFKYLGLVYLADILQVFDVQDRSGRVVSLRVTMTGDNILFTRYGPEYRGASFPVKSSAARDRGCSRFMIGLRGLHSLLRRL